MAYRNYSVANGFIVSKDGTGDFTTIAAALTAATSGHTIFLKPGTYTENPILKSGVKITAWDGDSSTPYQASPVVTIVGKLTFTAAGVATVSNIYLQTNSDYLLAVTGSAASIVQLNNCTLNCLNHTGIDFTSSSASSEIDITSCTGNLGTTGIGLFTHSAAGSLNFALTTFGNTGGSTTSSTISSGVLNVQGPGNWTIPISFTGTSLGTLYYNQFNCGAINTTPITVDIAGALNFEYVQCYGGSATALVITAGTVSVRKLLIDSTNASALSGAGTLLYDLITYTNTSSTNSISTQVAKTTQPPFSSAVTPCYFQTYLNAPQTISASTPTTVVFNTTNSNVGSGYDTGTGIFTAPTTGFYQFNCILEGIMNITGAQTDFVMALTGSVQSFRLAQVSSSAFDGNSIVQTGAWAMPMTAGDTVQVIADAAGTGTFQVYGAAQSPSAFNNISQFSGYRVY